MTTLDATQESIAAPDAEWRWADLGRYGALFVTLGITLHLVARAIQWLTGLDLVDLAYQPGSRVQAILDALSHGLPLLVVWILFARRGTKWRRPLGLQRPSGALAVSIAAGAAGLIAGAKGIFVLIAIEQPEWIHSLVPPELSTPSTEVYTGWGLAVTLLTTGVIVALAEELVYRGVIFGCLRQRLGLWVAALLSAAIFALVHPLTTMPFAFAAGLFLAWLYHRSRSLWPGIVVHGVNNLATMLMLAAVARA